MGKQKDFRHVHHSSHKKKDKKIDKVSKPSRSSCHEGFLKSIEIIVETELETIASAKKIGRKMRKELERYPLLAKAVFLGCERAVDSILEAGENVNIQIQDGSTPLIIAVENGYPGIVQKLLKKGADPKLLRQAFTVSKSIFVNGYKTMNVSFYIVLLAEFISIIAETESIPEWSWGAKSKYKRWSRHNFEKERVCSEGQCVKAWKCPKAAISQGSTGSCIYWRNGPWVCCVVNNIDNSHHWEKRNIYSTQSPVTSEYSKQTLINSWKENSKTDSADYEYNNAGQTNTPRVGVNWNRDTKERPKHINPLGDILKNVHGLYPTSRLWNKITKPPLVVGTKKTTRNTYNKQTSFYLRTTLSWNKPETTVSRAGFPTESVLIPKVTKRTSYTQATSKPWTRSTHASSTKVPLRFTTGYTERTVSKTTRLSNSRKPTLSTKASTFHDEKEQGWRNPTTAYPSRGQTKPIKTNRPRFTLSTVRSTQRSQVTTPLPNVNIYLCGIRGQRKMTNRQRRSSIYERNKDYDVVNPGTNLSKSRESYGRIVGGEEAEPFSWPWVVALYKVTSSGGNRFLSAGSLINENFILTAAHVFTPEDLRTASYVAMLGTHDAQDAVAEYVVSSVQLHPRYEHRYYYHDIALLRLERAVHFNNYVMPVCLPSPDAPLLRDRDLQGKNVTVMGWGDVSFGGKSSRVLQEATFPIISRAFCNTSYVRVASNRFPKGITNDMLCAGDPNGGKDACQGDSGGPLTSMENGRHTQVGIVSFGYQCGDKEFPGVYTKVAPYLGWIAENTQQNDDYIVYDY